MFSVTPIFFHWLLRKQRLIHKVETLPNCNLCRQPIKIEHEISQSQSSITSTSFAINHNGVLRHLSQAAACDGMIYSVNYNGQNSVTQDYALPLFED